MIIKICGITRAEDADHAARAGADWIGLNLWPRSRRHVEPELAAEVAAAARAARPGVRLVGVFVDEEPERIEEMTALLQLDFVQLHGDESPEVTARFGARAIKALAVAQEVDVERIAAYGCSTFLVDTPTAGRGGSGVVGDWALARRAAALRPVLLAGGLTPDNVAAAVAAVGPFGVDVASGVERAPGVKDAALVERFIAEARRAAP
ncbi:MAG TPA: phosphoribosylanthranilate isomerase [Kofleriaceae bacterium]|nr:phosphoribosylanthranilate isomerase [Kofleriaceae bacterium]